MVIFQGYKGGVWERHSLVQALPVGMIGRSQRCDEVCYEHAEAAAKRVEPRTPSSKTKRLCRGLLLHTPTRNDAVATLTCVYVERTDRARYCMNQHDHPTTPSRCLYRHRESERNGDAFLIVQICRT
jgi:hypothetical protein